MAARTVMWTIKGTEAVQQVFTLLKKLSHTTYAYEDQLSSRFRTCGRRRRRRSQSESSIGERPFVGFFQPISIDYKHDTKVCLFLSSTSLTDSCSSNLTYRADGACLLWQQPSAFLMFETGGAAAWDAGSPGSPLLPFFVSL